MTRIAVLIPTLGRSEFTNLLASLVSQLQDEDRVMVTCDDMTRYDFVSEAVGRAREEASGGVTWRVYPTEERLGAYGHPARNRMLDLLAELDDAPDWVWSLDDDDCATFGALDMIRTAVVSGDAPWYVFQMRGGAGSHFASLTVPTMGPALKLGNVGTPMLVFPLSASRFGTTPLLALPPGARNEPGYYGDYQMAGALNGELGAPAWVASTVCEVRPVAVTQ